MRGRFIVLEGGEGSGKSTQARLLAAELGALLTSEPGGTELGRHVREVVLGSAWEGLDARAEALLLLADRAQHVSEVVRPALERGTDVVSDRFSASTLAYQGHGRGLDVERLRQLSSWAAGGLEPDLFVLLDVPRQFARARLRDRPDRFEAEDEAFHRRVEEGYRRLAAGDGRWVVIDGTGSVESVAARLQEAVRSALAPAPGLGGGLGG